MILMTLKRIQTSIFMLLFLASSTISHAFIPEKEAKPNDKAYAEWAIRRRVEIAEAKRMQPLIRQQEFEQKTIALGRPPVAPQIKPKTVHWKPAHKIPVRNVVTEKAGSHKGIVDLIFLSLLLLAGALWWINQPQHGAES